jgi:hypothetical protein
MAVSASGLQAVLEGGDRLVDHALVTVRIDRLAHLSAIIYVPHRTPMVAVACAALAGDR